jgi:hypothetical protein
LSHPVQRTVLIATALALVSLAGCGSSASDNAIKRTIEHGVAQISGPRTTKQLHDDLVGTLAKLRAERASTRTGREARTLAIRGFTWTLRGVKARLEITRNDSGSLEASVQDAKRADREMRRGAGFLRAAARALGVRVGKLNGF